MAHGESTGILEAELGRLGSDLSQAKGDLDTSAATLGRLEDRLNRLTSAIHSVALAQGYRDPNDTEGIQAAAGVGGGDMELSGREDSGERPANGGGEVPATSVDTVLGILEEAGAALSLDTITELSSIQMGEPRTNKQTSGSLTYLYSHGKVAKAGRGKWMAAMARAKTARSPGPSPGRVGAIRKARVGAASS